MTERAITFSGEMVRAILEGHKTQTRRPLQHVPVGRVDKYINDEIEKIFWHPACRSLLGGNDLLVGLRVKCPFGKVGDRLWVRETWALPHPFDPYKPSEIKPCSEKVSYLSNRKLGSGLIERPAIHMPKWASRILLEITDIRVERVQKITHADSIAEGVKSYEAEFPLQDQTMPLSCHAFAHLWNSLYAKKGFGWEVNPWVWVLEFRRVA